MDINDIINETILDKGMDSPSIDSNERVVQLKTNGGLRLYPRINDECLEKTTVNSRIQSIEQLIHDVNCRLDTLEERINK
jgi:hypothetical protein